MPKKPCAHPGCSRLIEVGESYCPKHAVVDQKERSARSEVSRGKRPYAKWYSRKAWQDKRRKQLNAEPLCAMCPDHSRQLATVADHVIPHNGDHGLFWFGDLQSLCAHCHSSKKQRMERRAKR